MKHRGEEELDPLEFNDLLKERAKIVEMDSSFFKRSVNEAFPAARKSATRFCRWRFCSRNWRFLTKPIPVSTLTRSASSLKASTNCARRKTDYFSDALPAPFNYIEPDFVHVLADGKIVKEGGKELALELEEKGYDWVKAAGK
jgi:Fe-S cluster assembly ATP-binding protein